MATERKPRRGDRHRANGQGTIYQVAAPPGLRREAKYYYETGRRVKQRFTTEREARATLDGARRRRDAGLDPMPKRHTIADLFDA